MPERLLSETEIKWKEMMEAALDSPGKLSACYSLHSYSFLNMVRLMMQGCMEPAGPYGMWVSLGRHIKKGATKKEVIKPVIIQVDDPDTGEKVEKLIGFKPIRSAFALSDTEGKEIVIPEPPEWNLERAEKQLGITRMPFEGLDINVQGHSRGHNYALNPVARYPLKTAIHEFGHILLGHTTKEKSEEYKFHRGVQEFQAEATAHLTLAELAMLDEELATATRGYIQNWLEGERPPDAAIRQVFSTTERILKAGRIAPSVGRLAVQGAMEE